MAKTKAKTVADWRAVHDKDVVVPQKIQAALEAMLKEGPENWEYSVDFIKLAGISTTDLAKYREQFIKHIVTTPSIHGKSPRDVWFANPKVAAKIRGE